MKKDDVMNLIRKSLPGDYTYKADKGLYLYKPDDNLRIAFDEKSEPSFEEPWTENFPNKEALLNLFPYTTDARYFISSFVFGLMIITI